ncbi:NLI interacting factor [Macleaya cordata]|uniref:NLI interacting factor n=1 Tax=Macleaya cordata TaxID=56857 RepID=A0A200QX71_MACCD|nr:NLI interacting factor [Macleaya cordata]
MGPPKKANRKQTEIPLIKIEAFDTALQTTEDVSKNKRKMQDDCLERQSVKEKLESALETTEKHAEVSERKKKRKSERSNTLENNDLNRNLVEETLEKSEGKSLSTSLQNTETISEITNKPNPEFGVNGNHVIALQTADDSVKGNATGKRIKSKKKRHNESQNTDPGENLLVAMKHLDKDNSFSEISDLNLSRNKTNNEISMHRDLIAVEPRTSSKSVTNSMTKNDLTTEINFVSVEKRSLITYQRKKKKLSHSQGKQCLLSKEEAPSSSLQDTRNSSKEEVLVNYSNDMLTLMESKGRIKSENVNCEENELASGKRKEKKVKKLMQTVSGDEIRKNRSRSDVFDQHLVDENESELSKVHVGISVEENVEESKNGCKKDKSLVSVETGDMRKSPAVEDISLGKSSANSLGPVTSKRKRKKDKKKKMLPGEGNSSSLPAVEDPHPNQPEDLEARYAFGEDDPKVKLEIPELSLCEHKMEEMIPLSSSKSDIKGVLIDKGDDPLGMLIKEGCSSLLPAVEDVSLGKNSANNLVPASSRRGRQKKRKDVKHTANADKASEKISLCDPHAEQLEPVFGEENLVMEESPPLGEKNLEVEAVHVSGEENLDIAQYTCQMEDRTSPNEDVIKDAFIVGVMNKEDNHLNMLPASLVRAPISCTRRKLLVLDLNGILVDIVSEVPKGYKAHKQIARKALFKRPFCDDFLKFCFENFNVGVWSSRMKRNVNTVVDFLMEDMKNNLLFCWDQAHCTETGVGTLENRQKPLVLKELKKLWNKHEHSLPWEKGTYDESNTLLLDDSPYKALRNPPHTAIFPRSYSFQDTEDNSLGPGGDLRVYLEGLVSAENVQEYVKQHPFGQRAITNKNPSWGFYLRIIGANTVPTEADINSSSTHLKMGSTG